MDRNKWELIERCAVCYGIGYIPRIIGRATCANCGGRGVRTPAEQASGELPLKVIISSLSESARCLGVAQKSVDLAATKYWAREVSKYESAALSQRPVVACTWTGDENGIWETACGESWQFTDGGPADNSYRFCHGCGHPVAPQQPSRALAKFGRVDRFSYVRTQGGPGCTHPPGATSCNWCGWKISPPMTPHEEHAWGLYCWKGSKGADHYYNYWHELPVRTKIQLLSRASLERREYRPTRRVR